jgi:hypothetical protein
MRADIVTIYAALTDVFLDAISLQVRAAFQQRHLCKPNIVFVNMFTWFVNHYGKMMAKDCKAKWQCMVAYWHLANGFDALFLRPFTSTLFAGCTNYMMAKRNIVNNGLRLIKRCSCKTKVYKAWITCKAVTPRIIKTFNTFKLFWATKIMLVNQTAIPASMHSYGMAAGNDNDSSSCTGS